MEGVNNIYKEIKTTFIGTLLLAFALIFAWNYHETMTQAIIAGVSGILGIGFLFAKDRILNSIFKYLNKQ